MHIRTLAGILVLAALLIAAPAAALLSVGEALPAIRTGNVWVTIKNINGTGAPENIAVAYAMGDVVAIPANQVFENSTSGTTSVFITDVTRGTSPFTLSESSSTSAISDSYVINSVTVATEGQEPMLVNSLAFATVPATANFYTDLVPEGKEHEWIDLDWKDKNKDLDLTVYAPDETFGPYSDTVDGKKDGRIFLDVASRLNVTAGHWFFKIQNRQETKTPYTLNTYSS
jgi:hypothetical protein|nr:hypothetical protein [uncultured Methanoregula sp.]